MGKCGRIPLVVFTEGNVNMAYDKNNYNKQYKKDNFDQIKIYVPKGFKDKFKNYAESQGTTMSELLKDYISDKINV